MTTIISIDKIIAAKLTYINQHNNFSLHRKPSVPTVHGTIIPDGYAAYHADYPFETALERASRLDIIDHWLPNLYIRMQGGVRLTFTGDRAISIWEAYKAREFSSKSKQQKGQHDTRRSKEQATKD